MTVTACEDIDFAGKSISDSAGDLDINTNIEMPIYDINMDDLDADYVDCAVLIAPIADIDYINSVTFSEVDVDDHMDIEGEVDCYDVYPDQDNFRQCGLSGKRWADVYCVTLNEGDHVYSEKSCPLCNAEFKNGEALISYVLSNTEEGTRCIPAHLTCIKKSENQTIEKHAEVIQKLKDNNLYIDPIESYQNSLNRGQKPIKEVTMETVVSAAGNKAILITRGDKTKAYSEEELEKLKKTYTKKLEQIESYLNELNK